MQNGASAGQYFVQDRAPGQYFSCSSYGVMNVEACARNFRVAPQLATSGRLHRCVGCELGATHAGCAPVRARTVCVRCRRDARSAGTMMGRIRLVRGHTVCVSCYNREREVRRGTNAKGVRPKKWSGLFHARAACVSAQGCQVIAHPDLVVDRVELALTLIRRGHDQGMAWTGPVVNGSHGERA